MKYHLSLDLEFKKNPYPGTFIVLEGIDGSGKTFQTQEIGKELAKKNTVFFAKNPTSNPIGMFINQILDKQMKVPKNALQTLFAADRQAQQTEIIEHLKEGDVVVMDRYFWSAIAYGIADESPADFLLFSQSVLALYHQQIMPDRTFYLKIPYQIGLDRVDKMDRKKSIYERGEKLKKAQAGYDWLAKKFPQAITIVDGTKSKEEVTKDILEKICTFDK